MSHVQIPTFPVLHATLLLQHLPCAAHVVSHHLKFPGIPQEAWCFASKLEACWVSEPCAARMTLRSCHSQDPFGQGPWDEDQSVFCPSHHADSGMLQSTFKAPSRKSMSAIHTAPGLGTAEPAASEQRVVSTMSSAPPEHKLLALQVGIQIIP